MEHNRVIYTTPYDNEVEYLELTGTQWLDTGYYGGINTAMECVCKVTDTTKKFPIAGARDSVNTTITFMYGESKLYCDFVVGNYRLDINISNIQNYVYLYTSKNLRMIKDITSGTEYKNTRVFTGTNSPSKTIKIGKYETGFPRTYGNMYGRIKSFKLWSSDILLLDLIPVRRGNVGYLYDKVSKKLFANKGTGNFILGQDVSNPVPNIRRVFRFDNKMFVAISND